VLKPPFQEAVKVVLPQRARLVVRQYVATEDAGKIIGCLVIHLSQVDGWCLLLNPDVGLPVGQRVVENAVDPS